MPLLNKLFGKYSKKPSFAKSARQSAGGAKEGKEEKVSEKTVESLKKSEPIKKNTGFLISPLTTEKAVSSQGINKYIFKVAPNANKIEISKEISREYNVKAVSVNIINVPRKARQVGRTRGFKSGYKKAVVTLAKGQSIEVK